MFITCWTQYKRPNIYTVYLGKVYPGISIISLTILCIQHTLYFKTVQQVKLRIHEAHHNKHFRRLKM